MYNSYFCFTPKMRQFMSFHQFSSNDSKIKTTDTFYWLKLVTVILSFLKLFSLGKTTAQFFNILEDLRENQQKSSISGISWALKSKLQIRNAANYIVLLLRHSNNCALYYLVLCIYIFYMLIYSVSYLFSILPYLSVSAIFLSFYFYFHAILLTLFAINIVSFDFIKTRCFHLSELKYQYVKTWMWDETDYYLCFLF